MSYASHYADFKWIKVKRHQWDPGIPAEENYADLDAHHRKETRFLIAEVRRLAAELDRVLARDVPEGGAEAREETESHNQEGAYDVWEA